MCFRSHPNQHDLSLDLLQAAVYRLCNIVGLELHFLDTGRATRLTASLPVGILNQCLEFLISEVLFEKPTENAHA